MSLEFHIDFILKITSFHNVNYIENFQLFLVFREMGVRSIIFI